MTDWSGRFIAASEALDSAPQFRKDFSLDDGHGAVVSAVLRFSALGVCEAWINGRPVTDAVLTPGWTSYEWRIHYAEVDVVDLVSARSTLGLTVGNGWYRGRLGWVPTRRYGDEIGAFAELRVRFADGHEQLVVTDETWTAGPGPVTADDLYDGQEIDARRGDATWQLPGGDQGWAAVRVLDHDVSLLTPDPAPPVRRVARLQPVRTWLGADGELLLDFGQNVVGWLELKVRGPAGTVVVARHAEVLEDGTLAVRPLRSAAATDRYVLSGEDDTFEPTFTFHGFRYAELSGLPDPHDEDSFMVEAVVISSDLPRLGTFECSVPDLNVLHDNVIRGMRGNFVDLPTDCPQRDERMGWTGDISVFAPTAAFLFDVKEFLLDWLRDLELEQIHHDGIVPFVVPDMLKYAIDPNDVPPGGAPAAIWSDAAVWVPWAMWEAYGDTRVLEQTYWSMSTHGRRLLAELSPSGTWSTGFQFGDWLDPDAPAEHPELAKADPHVVATACAYRTLRMVSDAARVVGHTADAEEFDRAAQHVRAGFRRAYVDGERILSDSVTVYTLAITFGLLDEAELGWAGNRLAELVDKGDHRIATGFIGTPFVTEALTRTGHLEDAYRLLLQRECPSWLYPVTMGATTIWERWDSMLPDGSINPGDMTSFNHYALGAVADWMHRTVGGIAPLEPGYSRVLLAPRPGGGLTWAETGLMTPHGRVAIRWEQTGGELTAQVTLPNGVTGVLDLPGTEPVELAPGMHRRTVPAAVRVLVEERR